MSATTQKKEMAANLEQLIDRHLDKALPGKLEEIEAGRTPSMALIATKGTLDWAYPPFILASTGSALGWDVSVFFTFYGLLLLKKDLDAEVSPLGNPAMPMKMPFGPKWFQNFVWPMPNVIMAGIPGFEKVATALMKKTFKNKGVASVRDYRPDYRGGVMERDSAYHQGTAWAWLLGHYALAEYRVYNDAAAAQARLEPTRDHLRDAGLGTVSEIFDGAAPHAPRGAPAQAWSVACVLEAWWRLERIKREAMRA